MLLQMEVVLSLLIAFGKVVSFNNVLIQLLSKVYFKAVAIDTPVDLEI